jgi:hypothetical protein
MKISVLVEEGLRRLRNCSRGLDAEVRRRIMGKWARKLQRIGYPTSVRHQVITEAVAKYKKMCRTEDESGRPIHRARDWQKAARRLDKERKATSWHKNNQSGLSAPLIVDPSAGKLVEKMKSACKSFSESLNIHVTVKLRAGKSVKADAKSEPLRSKECGRIECMSCTPGGKGGCERNGIGYRITCEGCQGNGVIAEYEGESGRNGYSRGLEHATDLRNESYKSPLWKHCQLLHGGEKQKFLMVVLSSFRSCLERQVNKAVRITSSKAEVVLNSKTEFHQAPSGG